MASGAEFDFAGFGWDAAAEVAFAASFDGHADPYSHRFVCSSQQCQCHCHRHCRQLSLRCLLLSYCRVVADAAVLAARMPVYSIAARFAFVNCHLLFDFRLSRRLQSMATHTLYIVIFSHSVFIMVVGCHSVCCYFNYEPTKTQRREKKRNET